MSRNSEKKAEIIYKLRFARYKRNYGKIQNFEIKTQNCEI